MKKYYPDLNFEQANLREIPLPYQESSDSLFASIRQLPWALRFDSCKAKEQQYDIITADPLYQFVTEGLQTCISNKKGPVSLSFQNPFDILNDLYKALLDKLSDGPFRAGFAGYFSYDLARRLENLPSIANEEIKLPEMAVGLYDWSIVFDHINKTCSLYWLDIAEEKDSRWQTIMQILQLEPKDAAPFSITSPIKSNMTSMQYREAFQVVQDHLTAGDCYQVNLTQQFSCNFSGDTLGLYQALKAVNPMPFSAYCNFPFADIVSISPERFIQCKNSLVETKPIKGTRPRGCSPEDDLAFAEDLLNSEKDKAENTMIVDLLRNDLGKCCEAGSIEVTKLCELETYDSVHHLVSTIHGKLRSDQTPVDLLQSCFPGGSITGAPKISAMNIIEKLEPCKRNIYCGSIGYLDLGGRLDTNIAIRTLLIKDKKLYFAAGGGIVYDSECEAEYEESFNKVNLIKKILLLNQTH